MTNTNLLKSKMVAAGDDHYTDKICEIIGVTYPTANNKLNNKIPFTQKEIIELAVHYGWSNEEIGQIFMNDERRK
mgnify:CR=1 FL=1